MKERERKEGKGGGRKKGRKGRGNGRRMEGTREGDLKQGRNGRMEGTREERKEANIEHPSNYFISKIVSVTSFSKTISRQGIHFPCY